MADKAGLDSDLQAAWYALCEKIDSAMTRRGYELNDDEFVHLVNAWFGDGAHDAFLEWYEGD